MMKKVDLVSTDFEYDFIPVGARLVVNRMCGAEFLGNLDRCNQRSAKEIQNCLGKHQPIKLTASFSSEPDVMIVYQHIPDQFLHSTR